MIEDAELRALFQAESEERIKHLNDELKLLENDPHNTLLLDNVFREAHSLKGAARMLNLHDIEKLVHILEDHFALAKKGSLNLSKDVIYVFLEFVDSITDLVEEAVTGKPSDQNIDTLINKLKLINVSTNAGPQEIPKDKTHEQTTQKEEFSNPHTIPNAPFTAEKQEKILKNIQYFQEQPTREKISTIRVNYQKIDSLSNQVAELIVIKNRMNPLIQQIEECAYLWDESYNAILRAYRSFLKQKMNGDHLQSKISIKNDLKDLEEKYFKKLRDGLSMMSGYAYREVGKLETLVNSIVDNVRQLSLVPLSKLFDLFPRMVRDIARSRNKEIQLMMTGGQISIDKRIVELIKDPLMHLIRNCIDHGIESSEEREALGKPKTGTITLNASQTPKNIIFEVMDDGRGINLAKIKQKAIEKKIYVESELEKLSDSDIQNLIFSPGFSTADEISEISGRGIGLNVVSDGIQKMNGVVTAESKENAYCLFRIELPISLVTTHVLLVKVYQMTYAIQMDTVESCSLLDINNIFTLDEQSVVYHNQKPVSVGFLKDFLDVDQNKMTKDEPEEIQKIYPTIFIKILGESFGILVDEIIGEQKVVLTPPVPILQKCPNLAGTLILNTGKVCILLNVMDLFKGIHKRSSTLHLIKESIKEHVKKTILYVDDSATMQIFIKRILEKAHYNVILASDGIEGLRQLENNTIHAIISDIEMPHMDGITMLSKIKLKKAFEKIPFIFFSNLPEKKLKQKCLEAGANAYILKEDLNQKNLLETLNVMVSHE